MGTHETHLLQIYLADHSAAAEAGRRLARRLSRNNRDTEWARELATLAELVELDYRTLMDLRRTVGARGGAVKRAGAAVLERLGRAKPNGRLVGYSKLSRVLESEALLVGIEGKRRLWAALRQGLGDEYDGFDFVALERSAGEQTELLADFHRRAATAAFGSIRQVPDA